MSGSHPPSGRGGARLVGIVYVAALALLDAGCSARKRPIWARSARERPSHPAVLRALSICAEEPQATAAPAAAHLFAPFVRARSDARWRSSVERRSPGRQQLVLDDTARTAPPDPRLPVERGARNRRSRQAQRSLNRLAVSEAMARRCAKAPSACCHRPRGAGSGDRAGEVWSPRARRSAYLDVRASLLPSRHRIALCLAAKWLAHSTTPPAPSTLFWPHNLLLDGEGSPRRLGNSRRRPPRPISSLPLTYGHSYRTAIRYPVRADVPRARPTLPRRRAYLRASSPRPTSAISTRVRRVLSTRGTMGSGDPHPERARSRGSASARFAHADPLVLFALPPLGDVAVESVVRSCSF